MNIRGIYKTSLIDFPGRICTVLFTGGCNLQCKYCHNPEFVLNGETLESYTDDKVLEFLKRRLSHIDGVVISGGEPTLAKNIDSFLEQVKSLPLDVKLDTNGLKPDIVRRLIDRGLLDYVAVDIKTSPEKYNELTDSKVDFSKIAECINILKHSSIDYEIRTTCIPSYTTLKEFESIRDAIGPVKNYYLQQFISSVPLIDESWRSIQPYPVKVLDELKEFVLTFADFCEVRGV